MTKFIIEDYTDFPADFDVNTDNGAAQQNSNLYNQYAPYPKQDEDDGLEVYEQYEFEVPCYDTDHGAPKFIRATFKNPPPNTGRSSSRFNKSCDNRSMDYKDRPGFNKPGKTGIDRKGGCTLDDILKTGRKPSGSEVHAGPSCNSGGFNEQNGASEQSGSFGEHRASNDEAAEDIDMHRIEADYQQSLDNFWDNFKRGLMAPQCVFEEHYTYDVFDNGETEQRRRNSSGWNGPIITEIVDSDTECTGPDKSSKGNEKEGGKLSKKEQACTNSDTLKPTSDDGAQQKINAAEDNDVENHPNDSFVRTKAPAKSSTKLKASCNPLKLEQSDKNDCNAFHLHLTPHHDDVVETLDRTAMDPILASYLMERPHVVPGLPFKFDEMTHGHKNPSRIPTATNPLYLRNNFELNGIMNDNIRNRTTHKEPAKIVRSEYSGMNPASFRYSAPSMPMNRKQQVPKSMPYKQHLHVSDRLMRGDNLMNRQIFSQPMEDYGYECHPSYQANPYDEYNISSQQQQLLDHFLMNNNIPRPNVRTVQKFPSRHPSRNLRTNPYDYDNHAVNRTHGAGNGGNSKNTRRKLESETVNRNVVEAYGHDILKAINDHNRNLECQGKDSKYQRMILNNHHKQQQPLLHCDTDGVELSTSSMPSFTSLGKSHVHINMQGLVDTGSFSRQPVRMPNPARANNLHSHQIFSKFNHNPPFSKLSAAYNWKEPPTIRLQTRINPSSAVVFHHRTIPSTVRRTPMNIRGISNSTLADTSRAVDLTPVFDRINVTVSAKSKQGMLNKVNTNYPANETTEMLEKLNDIYHYILTGPAVGQVKSKIEEVHSTLRSPHHMFESTTLQSNDATPLHMRTSGSVVVDSDRVSQQSPQKTINNELSLNYSDLNYLGLKQNIGKPSVSVNQFGINNNHRINGYPSIDTNNASDQYGTVTHTIDAASKLTTASRRCSPYSSSRALEGSNPSITSAMMKAGDISNDGQPTRRSAYNNNSLDEDLTSSYGFEKTGSLMSDVYGNGYNKINATVVSDHGEGQMAASFEF